MEAKEAAFDLRKGGMTYPEIQQYLAIRYDLHVTTKTIQIWVEAILAKELA